MTTKIQNADFFKLFESFSSTAFRLQCRDTYAVGSEGEELNAFLQGRPLPNLEANDWLRLLRKSIAEGKKWTNIHVLQGGVTPYLQFLFEWHYLYWSGAGVDVGVVPQQVDRQIRAGLNEDFWLFDEKLMVRLSYDEVGHFLGAEEVKVAAEVQRLRDMRDRSMQHSIPLQSYLSECRNRTIKLK